MYVITHSFYAYLVPPIVVGVLLTCQSLEPEYKMTAFFQMYLQEKKHCLIFGSIRYISFSFSENKSLCFTGKSKQLFTNVSA